VRAIAGSVEQRTAAASGRVAVNHREAARLASAVLAVRNLRLAAVFCFAKHSHPDLKISLYSLRPADAGTGTSPGANSDLAY
jgi:hypothetical protein